MAITELYKNIFTELPELPIASDLQAVSDKYPYFAAAHFFQLKNIAIDDENFKPAAAITGLHFNNPFYLNYLLNSKDVLPFGFGQNAKEKNFLRENQDKNIIQEGNENILPEREVASPAEIKIVVENDDIVPITESEVPAKEELVFEPLYTTDYFASQGIKLGEAIAPDDKLGKQLKSFTAWLKTMKKVHTENATDNNTAVDTSVQQIAEKSNRGEAVITESMAEVFVAQGKYPKARIIYEKLSLLDPSKSAYFAAKIADLNNK